MYSQNTPLILQQKFTVTFFASKLMMRSIRFVRFGWFSFFNNVTSLRALSHETCPRIESFRIATFWSLLESMALTITP